MDITKEKNTALVAPLDLYAEFARLCGAPKDMNLDEQIMLYEEYQRAIEVEMKEKIKAKTPKEECEKITDEFIKKWVEEKKEYFENAKGKSTSKAPPEAYAAFVRIYTNLMERDASEQLDISELSVRLAKFVHSISTSSSEFLGKRGSILYGAEFDEYISEIWVKFLERCNDVDKFADYLQAEFVKNKADKDYLKKSQQRFDKIQKNYLKRVFAEWDSKAKHMSDADLCEYLTAEYQKRSKEFAKIKKEFEETTAVGYPSLVLLLRRPAQNMMERLDEDTEKRRRHISLDAERESDAPSVLETLNVHNMTVEERFLRKEVVEEVWGMLSIEDQKIWDYSSRGFSQKQIAPKIGKSIPTVSRHLKKIEKLVKQVGAGIV